jgi:polyisoprenoid-binding protein YceI
MSTNIDIPGYVAGTWVIDPVDSAVSFQVKLLGMFTARGKFDDFEGTIVTAENPLDSSVNAVIRTTSVNTKNKRRDKDLQKRPYLNAKEFSTMSFTSTGVRADGDHFHVDGDLTIRAHTKSVTLSLAPNGFDVDGKPQARFSASTEIDCNDFGVTRGSARMAISNKVTVTLDVRASRQD